MSYGIHARSYMERARKRLDESTLQGLFYAAFELRCGIEARMEEYLEAQEHISEKKKKGWRIADLAKNLEEVFQINDKVVEFMVFDEDTREWLYSFYYTPVNSKLQKLGQRLGNYLHSMKKYIPEEDNYWRELRQLLEDAYSELEKASFGNMMGVPLIDPKTNQVHFTADVPVDENPETFHQKFGGIGSTVGVWVRYHDELPSYARKKQKSDE